MVFSCLLSSCLFCSASFASACPPFMKTISMSSCKLHSVPSMKPSCSPEARSRPGIRHVRDAVQLELQAQDCRLQIVANRRKSSESLRWSRSIRKRVLIFWGHGSKCPSGRSIRAVKSCASTKQSSPTDSSSATPRTSPWARLQPIFFFVF